jgi:hypothetical protein
MKRRVAPRALGGAAALALLMAVAVPAGAGSLVVRDGDNNGWTVNDDPQADANDLVLRHLVHGAQPDDRFGRDGRTTFTLDATNDAPASVRVDARHRIWMVGASVAGNQPQPVIARFQADGNADLHWGVQGKLQVTPAGAPVKPNDLLPLADGSVLVAGETTGVAMPRAVVFHLLANGTLDRAFGHGGLWQRPDDADASTATSLAASNDGLVAVAVAVRSAKPGAELWQLTDAGTTLLQRQPLDDTNDGEDLRAEWTSDHWTLSTGGGPTVVVPAALLGNRAHAAAASAASADPGQGGFNPFVAEAASAPEAAPQDDGLPWPWISAAIVLFAAVGAAALMRARRPQPALRKP